MIEPESEESSHSETNPGLTPIFDPGATQALKIRPVPPPVPETATTIRLAVTPPFPEARPEGARKKAPRAKYWGIGLLAVLMLGGSLGYYLLYPSGDAPAALQRTAEVPAAARPYLEKAAQGDAAAMQMLGYMYFNGLNVPQDRKEGVKWFRKAAAAGSVAARQQMEQLGLPTGEK